MQGQLEQMSALAQPWLQFVLADHVHVDRRQHPAHGEVLAQLQRQLERRRGWRGGPGRQRAGRLASGSALHAGGDEWPETAEEFSLRARKCTDRRFR